MVYFNESKFTGVVACVYFFHFDSESNTEYSHEALRLLYSPKISGDWMHFLVNNCDTAGLDFPGEDGRELLMDNLDFILSFLEAEKLLSLT